MTANTTALAEEVGTRAACFGLGVPEATYYRRARPKLALLSARRPAAPPVPDMSAAEVAMSTVAVEQPPVMPEEGAYTQCVLGKIHDFAINYARPTPQ